jgi:hypothetical protein
MTGLNAGSVVSTDGIDGLHLTSESLFCVGSQQPRSNSDLKNSQQGRKDHKEKGNGL